MNFPAKNFPSALAAKKFRAAVVWRLVQAMLPLGQRFNPLLSRLVGPGKYIAVPWGRHWLTIDAAWLKIASSASAPLYQTPRRQNPEFFHLMAPLLDAARGGHIVDVGANIGAYTLNIRAMTAAPVIAFDPDPALFNLLAHNVAVNNLHAVTVRNCACGDANGRLRFHDGINGAVATAGETDATALSVPVVRLDDELGALDGIDLIKIDCEGFEWHILNGCRRILERHRPALFVELHPKLIGKYGHSLAEVCDLLRAQYRLEFWDMNPSLRSPRRAIRFLGRYRTRIDRLDEAAALSFSARANAPDQIFMVASPRVRGP